jgi:hypothetical protein
VKGVYRVEELVRGVCREWTLLKVRVKKRVIQGHRISFGMTFLKTELKLVLRDLYLVDWVETAQKLTLKKKMERRTKKGEKKL